MEYTEAQVTDALERAVAAAGEDYRYTDAPSSVCHYEADVEHRYGCIVGYAFREVLGWSKFDYFEGSVDIGVEDSEALWGERLVIDDNVVGALAVAQRAQDRGEPWGVALEQYREALRGVYRYAD